MRRGANGTIAVRFGGRLEIGKILEPTGTLPFSLCVGGHQHAAPVFRITGLMSHFGPRVFHPNNVLMSTPFRANAFEIQLRRLCLQLRASQLSPPYAATTTTVGPAGVRFNAWLSQVDLHELLVSGVADVFTAAILGKSLGLSQGQDRRLPG